MQSPPSQLKILMNRWMTNSPDYFEVGTRVLSQEERQDPMKVYQTCDCDIIYQGLRVDMVTAFIAVNKAKPGSDKLYAFTNMRKTHDAVLFGASTVKQMLSSQYYVLEMDSFLWSFKEEAADARSQGIVDEQTADPMCLTLYGLLFKWAIEDGNILVWVWTILQWNLMAQSISVDPLSLNNFSISEDHFVVRHDSTKCDKEGDKTHNKGVHCNPLESIVCACRCWSGHMAVPRTKVIQSKFGEALPSSRWEIR